MGRRSYTETERAEAVALCIDVGMDDTHHRTGIPKPTLSRWMTPEQRAEMAERFQTKTAAATKAHALNMDQRRAELAQALMDDVERLRAQLFAPCVERRVVTLSGGLHNEGSWEIVDVKRTQPTFADQKAIITTLAIGVDKIQVLTGEATERVEVRDARARATELVDELARRRASKAA